MFGPSLAQVLGAPLLLSGADRLPPRTTLAAISLTFAVGTAGLALPGLPAGALLAVVLLLGLVASLGGGVRWGLLNEILDKDGYLPGRSLFNMMSGLLPPAVRTRTATPLLLLLATPYLVFFLHPPLVRAAACATVASVGFGASLVQQERLMRLTPDGLGGHALGLHSAGMPTLQGLSATLAGSVAQLTSPAPAMTFMALASLTVTLALATAARRERTAPSRVPAAP